MSGPQKESMASRILRAALERLPDQISTVTAGEVSIAMMVQTRRQHKRILNHLCDLVNAGKLTRVQNGVYRRPDAEASGQPEIRVVMWRLLRMRRAVSMGDLMEMAGASERYATEWLRMLEKKAIVRKDGGLWRLLVNTVEMPEDDEAAEKYRKLMMLKKDAALRAIAEADVALGKAREAVERLSEKETK